MQFGTGWLTRPRREWNYSHTACHCCVVTVAPGLGLLLDETIFEHYNQRYEREKRENRGMSAIGDVHVPLSLDAIAEQVMSFKKDVIYPHIVKEELERRPFGK
jgi:hypothetical protein